MSKTLTIAAAAITSLISFSSAEILSCNRDINPNLMCGPCSQPGLCNLQCIAREDICVESRLYCKQNEKCKVDCMAGYACMEAIIDASSATDLQLTCEMHTSCETTTVNAGMKTNIDVTCGGTENTCKDLMLNAHFGGNITVNCNSMGSCVGLTVNGANAENIAVNCNDNTGSVCNGVRIFCGTGDCSIACNGGLNKCPSIQVSTGSARSWTCIGTAMECQAAPLNYAPPTTSPTAYPTKAPTAITTNPTGAPSKAPSKRPTAFPSKSPTSRPTTPIPTTAPLTQQPSKNPTVSPTNKPSSDPTTSPTNKPTLKPTSDPTVYPTKPSMEPSYAPTRKGETKSPTKAPSTSPTQRPTDKPTDRPTDNPTITSSAATGTDTTATGSTPTIPAIPSIPGIDEDLGPSPAPIVVTPEPTTTAKPTTLPPTSNQLDEEICCECIEPSLGIKKCAKDPQCTEKICQVDPYCCENQWDNTCAYYASDQCTKSQQTPSTTAVAVQSSNPDLDLFWQLALVVFAIMVLIVSCCIILLRIHRMCQNCKNRKLQKEKSLSARKVKRRTNSQRRGGGITGALGIAPVNTPANSVYTASIKSGTNSTYYGSKRKLDEESCTMTHAEDDGLHHGHPMDTYSSHYGSSVYSGHPIDRNQSVPVKRMSSKSYIKRYYNIKSVGTMDTRSNASSGGNYSGNGHRFMRQQQYNKDPHDPNMQHMLGHGANPVDYMGNPVDLEFGDDHHKEDRYMINNIVNADDDDDEDDEDSLSMTDDTNFVQNGHAANTFNLGKVKRAKSVKNNEDPRFNKQDPVQIESHKSTETSIEREESDIDEEDDDVLNAKLISHPGNNHHKISDDMIDINIKEVMNKHEVDDGRPSFTQQKRRSGRVANALVDRTDYNDKYRDGDRRNNDDDRDGDGGNQMSDDDITVTDEHIDDMMDNLRKMQSVKHHSI